MLKLQDVPLFYNRVALQAEAWFSLLFVLLSAKEASPNEAFGKK